MTNRVTKIKIMLTILRTGEGAEQLQFSNISGQNAKLRRHAGR